LLLLLTGLIGWALAYWFARRRAYGVNAPERRRISDRPGPANSGRARA